MPLTRYYILENDTTTAGGVVQKTSHSLSFKVHGKKQSCIGDNVWCPVCGSMGQIMPSGPRLSFSLGSAMPALNDDLCLCKCNPPPKLIHSQTTFKEIIDDNRLAEYRQAQAQYRQAKLQNSLTNPISNDDDFPKFTVHFRRDDNYQGEYGFDWLRDEYVYDLTYVVIQQKDSKLLTSNQKKLLTEYRTYQDNPLKYINEIQDDTYTPAWLSLLPKQQVSLYLQIDQAENDASSLSDDIETLLNFECSEGLKLTLPQGGKSIALKDVVKSVEPTHVDLSFKEFNRYKKALRITIQCTSPLPTLGYIKVFVKKNNQSNLVGLLLVYPNQQALTTTIYPIYLSNATGQNNKPDMIPDDLADSISHRFLNQALVRADVKPLTIFNIADVYRSFLISKDFYSNEFKKLYAFITNYYTKPPYDSTIPLSPKSVSPTQFTTDLIELYELFMPTSVPTGGIYHQDSKATYLFFTEHYANSGKTKGIADGHHECQQGTCKIDWGNAVTVFNHTNLDGTKPSHAELTHTIMHELGHSYGLYHTFIQNELSTNSPHTFFRGYTDNLMDYQSFQLPQEVIDKWRANPTAEQLDNNNPRINTMFSLFKWQWDIIQNDKSIQRGQ